MKSITQEQMNEILSNAPEGTDKSKLVDKIVNSGIDIQGIDNEAIRSKVNIENKREVAEQPVSGLRGFSRGVGKGILSTVKGLGQLGEQVGGALLPESITPKDIYSEEALEQSAQEGGNIGTLLREENLEARGGAEKAGKFVEEVAEFAIPGSKIAKLSKGASIVPRIAGQALSSATVASGKAGEIGTDSAIAGGAEVLLPVAGKIIAKPVASLSKRLLKGVGSALSGAGVDTIEQIASNPELSKKITKELGKKGSAEIAEKNANSIITGIKDIQRSASDDFGKALEELDQVPVNKKQLSNTMGEFADFFGITKQGDNVVLDGVEFVQKRNINKAKNAINIVDGIDDFTGKNLRSVMKQVEGFKYKTSSTEEARAFNSFIDELSDRLQKTISAESPVLQEANRNYANSKNIIAGAEKVLAKTKYGQAEDVIGVANKLDGLFKKNELSKKYVQKFLDKAGIDSNEFMTSEAVRQISDISQEANSIGANPFEIIRSFTSSIITPKMIRDIAIGSGVAENQITKILPTIQKMFVSQLDQ